MASVYQRDNGSWRVVVELDRGPDGSRRRRYFDGKTEAEARAKMQAAYPEPVAPGVATGPERAGVTVSPDKSVTVVSELGKPLTLGDVDDLLRHHGLDPADWQIVSAVVNKWQTPARDKTTETWTQIWNYQLKVSMKPRLHLVMPMPARVDGPKYLPRPIRQARKSELIAILPDQQIPFHDEPLHELVCDWLAANKPDRMILSGDFYDFPSVSRHPKKAHELRMGGVQECLDVGYKVARDYVEAAGPTCYDRRIVPGNHEYRLQRAILDSLPELYNLHRAGDSTVRVFSLEHLSRLDELGFKWAADPVFEEHYPQGHVTLGDKLAVYHGWVVRPDSGASALKTLETLGHSVIVGHTHRQADVAHTFHEIDGRLRILRAAEAGTLARVKGGLGYSMAPNWQPGFLTVRLFPDGLFNIESAKYVNGRLMWQEQQYQQKAA